MESKVATHSSLLFSIILKSLLFSSSLFSSVSSMLLKAEERYPSSSSERASTRSEISALPSAIRFMTSTFLLMGPVIDFLMSMDMSMPPRNTASIPVTNHWFLLLASIRYMSSSGVEIMSMPRAASPVWQVLHLGFFSMGLR